MYLKDKAYTYILSNAGRKAKPARYHFRRHAAIGVTQDEKKKIIGVSSRIPGSCLPSSYNIHKYLNTHAFMYDLA